MRYNFLDNEKKIKVSEICLGSMTWGVQNNEIEAHQQIEYALTQGINFIDTAEIYAIPPSESTYGITEKYIGTWLLKNKSIRKDLVIASKIAGPNVSYIRGGIGITQKSIQEAIEGSLQRLHTDYLDVYQLHWPQRKTNFFTQYNYDPNVFSDENTLEELENLLETLHTLKKLVQQGKIKYIGVSNETAWGVTQFCKLYNQDNTLPKIKTIQNVYNLVSRAFDINLSEVCLKENVSLLAYSPLAGGLLSGKYQNNNKPEGARFSTWGFQRMARYDNGYVLKAIDEYVALAKKYQIHPSQMSIAFILKQPYLCSCIIGATSIEQLKTNIASTDIILSPDIIAGIEKIFDTYKNPAA